MGPANNWREFRLKSSLKKSQECRPKSYFWKLAKFRPESYLKESQEFRFNSCYRKLAGVSPQEVPDEIAGVSSLDLLVKTGRSFVARGT